jgi:hypothetical protein
MFSIAYRQSKSQFHSVSFQKLWSAEIRISGGTGHQDGFELLSIPPHFGIADGTSTCYSPVLAGLPPQRGAVLGRQTFSARARRLSAATYKRV